MQDEFKEISVILIDDHDVVIKGLQAFLASFREIKVVATALKGLEAIRDVENFAPDVVVLDLLIPGEDAIDTVRKIKLLSPRTQIVVLTSYDRHDRVVPLLRAGVLSYIIKDLKPHELAETIVRAAAGESVLNAKIAIAIVDTLKEVNPPANNTLTPRELEVLKFIAEGSNNKTIADRMGITEKTVKSHVSNILGKLYLDDRTQAAIYAIKSGLS